MVDFTLALPEEICTELGARARTRRISMNISVEVLASRIGVSDKTLRNFERTGRCNMDSFVRILEVLNATGDLQSVLWTQPRTIEDMRSNAAVSTRKRAYRKREVPL